MNSLKESFIISFLFWNLFYLLLKINYLIKDEIYILK